MPSSESALSNARIGKRGSDAGMNKPPSGARPDAIAALSRNRFRFAARAHEFHGNKLAAGPLTGEMNASLSIRSAPNPSRIDSVAFVAASRDSNHANTLGPAPEMLAPSAP